VSIPKRSFGIEPSRAAPPARAEPSSASGGGAALRHCRGLRRSLRPPHPPPALGALCLVRDPCARCDATHAFSSISGTVLFLQIAVLRVLPRRGGVGGVGGKAGRASPAAPAAAGPTWRVVSRWRPARRGASCAG